jgi:hypothetical protein
MLETLHTWVHNLDSDNNKIPARELYCGRGFSEISKTIGNNDLRLWIISAGVGLVSGDMKIPAYNLTVLPSTENSIQTKILSKERFQPSQWWNDLNQKLYGTPKPIYDLIRRNTDTYFVISLSKAYVNLIANDLFLLREQDQHRVRLTGLNSPKPLPEAFKHLWMPYDERYDGSQSPNPGTQSDFPQRVTRHFIEEVFLKNALATPQVHAETVSNILCSLPFPERVKRPTLSDEEIKQIIIRRWDDAKGSGSNMLRILRDDENVACEQGRCANLFKQIKSRMT